MFVGAPASTMACCLKRHFSYFKRNPLARSLPRTSTRLVKCSWSSASSSRRSNSHAHASLIAKDTNLGQKKFGWACSFTDRWTGGVCTVLSSGRKTSPNCRSSSSRFNLPLSGRRWMATSARCLQANPVQTVQSPYPAQWTETLPSPAPRGLPWLARFLSCPHCAVYVRG